MVILLKYLLAFKKYLLLSLTAGSWFSTVFESHIFTHFSPLFSQLEASLCLSSFLKLSSKLWYNFQKYTLSNSLLTISWTGISYYNVHILLKQHIITAHTSYYNHTSYSLLCSRYHLVHTHPNTNIWAQIIGISKSRHASSLKSALLFPYLSFCSSD